ncbi:MAG TPA: hypothetical protein PK706_11505, partial [Xanthobacteraceae bacterium]|nr:hypothetical protein [Xanthobacteraceae bacterium]
MASGISHFFQLNPWARTLAVRPVRMRTLLACAGVLGLLALAATGDARAQTAPAASQTQRAQVPATRSEITLSFAPVVARTAPAVVNVYALKSAPRSNPFFDDPFFRRFFGGGQG